MYNLAKIEKRINIVRNTKLYNSVVSKHNLQMLWILIEQNYLLITHRNAHFDYTKGVGTRDRVFMQILLLRIRTVHCLELVLYEKEIQIVRQSLGII